MFEVRFYLEERFLGSIKVEKIDNIESLIMEYRGLFILRPGANSFVIDGEIVTVTFKQKKKLKLKVENFVHGSPDKFFQSSFNIEDIYYTFTLNTKFVDENELVESLSVARNLNSICVIDDVGVIGFDKSLEENQIKCEIGSRTIYKNFKFII